MFIEILRFIFSIHFFLVPIDFFSLMSQLDELDNLNLTAKQRRRLQDRKEWEAYWRIRRHDTEGTWWPLVTYKMQKCFDAQVTWFREKIVEPLHDKNALPYYHRRLNRVPAIDECGVNDQVSLHEQKFLYN